MEEEARGARPYGVSQASAGPFGSSGDSGMEIDMINSVPPLASGPQWAPDVFAALQAPQGLVSQQATLQQQASPCWVPCTEVGGSEFGDGGGGGGSGGGGSRLTPAVMAEKLASAREKNRLAQQRFRERQRAKQREADEAEAALQKELEELKGDNRELLQQNRIYEKVLAVRDAMVHTLTSLHAGAAQTDQRAQGQQQAQQQQLQALQQQAQQQHAPRPTAYDEAAEAASDLARALGEMPTEAEMEQAEAAFNARQQQQQQVPPQVQHSASAGSASAAADAAPPSPQPQQQAPPQTQRSASGGSASTSADAAPQQLQPSWTLGEAHRSNATLDGSALREMPSIPPASDELVRQMVLAMVEPEDLLDYYREWQTELSLSYEAAEAAGFDAASVAEVEAVQARMASVWWHVGHLKPSYLSFLAHAALPANSGQFELWRQIAALILPQLDASSRAILRRCWYQYSKALARIAVKAQRWMQRLQAYTARPLESMATHAAHSLELLEITSQLSSAVQDEYIASMEFLAGQAQATTELQKALINKESTPYMPDLVAIVYQMLKMDSEERRQTAGAAGLPGTAPADMPGTAPAAPPGAAPADATPGAQP